MRLNTFLKILPLALFLWLNFHIKYTPQKGIIVGMQQAYAQNWNTGIASLDSIFNANGYSAGVYFNDGNGGWTYCPDCYAQVNLDIDVVCYGHKPQNTPIDLGLSDLWRRSIKDLPVPEWDFWNSSLGIWQPAPSQTNLPCPGDPIKNPTICSSGASGKAGGMFGCVRISPPYSARCDSLKRYHDGIDIEYPVNQNIYAMYDGVVIEINNSFSPGQYAQASYGNYITIRHTWPDGSSIDIKYNHLNSVGLNVGDPVTNQQIIGQSGNTGNAAANNVTPHVHIQTFINNASVDPKDYFATSFNTNGTVNIPCNN